MLKYLSIIAIFLSASILFAQPKLEIEGGDTQDWGKVSPEDSPLKADVKLWNKGNQVLEITAVKPGCGCTTAPLDKDKINPGEYATLSVSLNVGTHSGPMTKGITISTNDPEAKHQRLRLKADVYSPYKLFPRYLSFGSLTVGQPSVAKVVITNNTDKPMKITDFNFEPAGMTLNIEKGTILQPNADYTIIAELTPKESGNLKAHLNLFTNHPDARVIEISGWGRVRDSGQSTGKK